MVCHSVSFIPSKKYSAFVINSPKLPKLRNRGAIDSRTFLSEFSSFRTSCGSRLPFLPVPFLLFWSKEPQAAGSYEAIFHTGCIPSNFGNAGEDPGGNCGAEGPLWRVSWRATQKRRDSSPAWVTLHPLVHVWTFQVETYHWMSHNKNCRFFVFHLVFITSYPCLPFPSISILSLMWCDVSDVARNGCDVVCGVMYVSVCVCASACVVGFSETQTLLSRCHIQGRLW